MSEAVVWLTIFLPCAWPYFKPVLRAAYAAPPAAEHTSR